MEASVGEESIVGRQDLSLEMLFGSTSAAPEELPSSAESASRGPSSASVFSQGGTAAVPFMDTPSSAPARKETALSPVFLECPNS